MVSSCLFMRKHFLAGCTYHNLPNTLRRVMFRFIVVVNSPNWPLTITTFDRLDFFPNSRFDVQRFCYATRARRKRRCWNTLISVQRPEMNWIFTFAKQAKEIRGDGGSDYVNSRRNERRLESNNNASSRGGALPVRIIRTLFPRDRENRSHPITSISHYCHRLFPTTRPHSSYVTRPEYGYTLDRALFQGRIKDRVNKNYPYQRIYAPCLRILELLKSIIIFF